MPIYSTDYHNRDQAQEAELSDPFTRLVIPTFQGDTGDRPTRFPRRAFSSNVNVGLRIVDRSSGQPVETFQVWGGEAVKVRITVRNRGTIDATSALVECYYEPRSAAANRIEDMSTAVLVFARTILLVPAQGERVVEADWRIPSDPHPTRPDSFLLKVRVTDVFSLMSHPTTAVLWDAKVNAQSTFRKFFRARGIFDRIRFPILRWLNTP